MSEEEKEVFDRIKDRTQNGCKCGQCCDERILINIIEKYKRYFKLAISDLQSEGYMQMPYENVEKYYSKREDVELINDFISKDKIREKIEKLKEIADEDNPDDYIKIDAYEELLEEKY